MSPRELLPLNYESPDEDRPAAGVSPFGQAMLGVATYFVLLCASIWCMILWGRSAPVILVALSLCVGICIWTHFRWRWYEFVPAMLVCLIVTLLLIPIAVGIWWWF